MRDEARQRVGVLAVSSWIALLLALFALSLFLLGYSYLASPSAFNSDNLLSSAQCGDLLHGRDMTGWHLPGAPYLFPDLTLLAPCQLLAPNIVGEFLAYYFVLHSLLLAVLVWLGRLSGLGWRRAVGAAACGSILLAAVHTDKFAGWRACLLVHPGSHLGAILVGLFLLAWTMHTLRRGPSWAGGVVFLSVCTLGTFSDRLLAAQFLAPLALALAFLALRRSIPVRKAAGYLALMGISFLLAGAIQSAFRRLGFHFEELETHLARWRFPDLFYLLRHLYHGIESEHLLCALIPLHLLAALLVIRMCLVPSAKTPDDPGLDRRAILLACLTILLSPPCILGTLFVLDMAHHLAIDRYTLSCCFLPCLLLPMLMCWLPGRAARIGGGMLQVGVVLLALHRAALLLPTIDRSKFEQPYPPLARELDRLARERGPLYGLGGFWVARSTGWFTREQVTTNQLSPLGEPWFHASNAGRFLSEDRDDLRAPAYQFLLVRAADRRDPPPALLTLHYGQPAEKIVIGGDQIWLYDSLRLSPLDRFLRSRLADRLCARRPYTGPAEPACLARPKPSLTSANAPGNVALEAGQSLEVRFGQPVAGRLLDVGADFNNRLDLDFYRGEQRLARLPVPIVPWTGACYGQPGIQSRLLPLPAVLRDRPWDRVVVRPRTKAEKICLGHLLVFAEEIPGLNEEWSPPRRARMRLEGEELFPINPGTPFTDDADPTASGGRVRRAAVDFPCSFCYTPLLYLAPGRYRLACALKAGPHATGDELARIRVGYLFPPGTATELCLHGNDFPGPGTPALHGLTFTVTEDTEGVQLGVSTTGKTPIDLDYLDLIPEPPDSPGEK